MKPTQTTYMSHNSEKGGQKVRPTTGFSGYAQEIKERVLSSVYLPDSIRKVVDQDKKHVSTKQPATAHKGGF
jgi:hypothetical protein